MAWRRSGAKPLSEPMMVSLLTHICITRPQWVNTPVTVSIGVAASLAPNRCQDISCNNNHDQNDEVIKWKHFPLYWSFVRVTGGCPSQRPVTRSFDVFFDLRLNIGLRKHSIRRWFETPSCSLWRRCNGSWSVHIRRASTWLHRNAWKLMTQPRDPHMRHWEMNGNFITTTKHQIGHSLSVLFALCARSPGRGELNKNNNF